ncbi:MAG: polysaccharide biosynthesis tyrosine autokinase [bacterium]|nr:polysaccharide biosynthesis tyrosine autokinase [bacterium]
MDQRQIFLRDVLTVLFKRKVLILFFALVVFGVVFAGNYVWPPTYESVAKVRIMEGRDQQVADPTVTRSAAEMITMGMTIEDVNSEMEMIYSDDVLEEVIDALKLDTRSAPPAGNPVRAALRGAKQAYNELTYALALRSKPTDRQRTVNGLRRAIEVIPVEKSHVLEIRCRYSDPDTAQEILTEVIVQFKEKHKDVFAQPESRPFFTKQYERVKTELAAAQQQLRDFRNENDILEIDVERELLLEAYNKAKRLTLQLETLGAATEYVKGAKEPDSGAIVGLLSRETESPVITELRLKLLEKVQRRNEVMQTKGPQHPDRRAINNEIEKAVIDLEKALELSMAGSAREIAGLEERLQKLNNIMAQHDELDLDVSTRTASLEYYAEKLEESIVADAVSEFNISSIREISSPNLPVDPVSPRKLFNLLVALIAGIVGGIGLSFFFEYLDHGVKTPEDVEHYLKAPPLASFFHTPYEQLDPREAQRLSTMLEAVHPEEPLRLLEVASSVGGEGSHRVARALAEACADDPERRTLLVDFVGDGIEETPDGAGLMDVLGGQAELSDVVSRMGNLNVVGRGSVRECPTYLWRSPRMKELLNELRGEFDRVVFHVAPILASHDALNLAQLADGCVLVVRSDSTRREVVARAMEMLNGAKGRVLGAVLTERRQVIPSIVYRRI